MVDEFAMAGVRTTRAGSIVRGKQQILYLQVETVGDARARWTQSNDVFKSINVRSNGVSDKSRGLQLRGVQGIDVSNFIALVGLC